MVMVVLVDVVMLVPLNDHVLALVVHLVFTFNPLSHLLHGEVVILVAVSVSPVVVLGYRFRDLWREADGSKPRGRGLCEGRGGVRVCWGRL